MRMMWKIEPNYKEKDTMHLYMGTIMSKNNEKNMIIKNQALCPWSNFITLYIHF